MSQPDNEEKVKDILKDAAEIAQRLGRASYTTFHLLLAMLRKDVFIRDWLERKGVHFNELLTARLPDSSEPFLGSLLSRVRQIANTAGKERKPVHLFYAILSFGEESHAKQAIRNFCDPDLLLREIAEKRGLGEVPGESIPEQGSKVSTSLFTDYTQYAREGKLRGVTGREEEIRAAIEILARKDSSAEYDEAINNPVFLGEPGVGKSALAKTLALMITGRDERARLFWNYRLLYVKLGELQAGTGIRGSLEERMKALLEECRKQKTILFLDELHILMDMGKTEGSSGLDQQLLPALSEGLSCMSATTTENWRKKIENKDAAFARRWIPVPIAEPDSEVTLRIVCGAADVLARRHLVHFPGEVLGTAVEMGRKFLPYYASPGREIEQILNGVGAKAKLEGRATAQPADVAKVITQITGMPILIGDDERIRITQSYELMTERIFGQDPAMRILADAIMRYRSGTADPNKPLTILSLGPTGVGKTLAAKTLAELFFYFRFFRLDMSEYMEKHTVSRLIGSPPGYVGYEQPGQLTEQLRRLGIAVILLDEIEKAHPDVLQIFLQLFDDGRLTDAQGRTVRANNCVFIMTSNLGADRYMDRGAFIGFGSVDQRRNIPAEVISIARGHFKPEFYNRIDEVMVYNALTEDDALRISTSLLEEEKGKYTQKFELAWTADVPAYLVRHGFDALLGARPMRRQVMRDIQTMLSMPLLTGEIADGDHVLLNVDGNRISWRKLPVR